MLRTVKKIKTITGKYELPVHIFEFSTPIAFEEESGTEYTNLALGGFYKNKNDVLNNFALFAVNEFGEYLSNEPILNVNGKNTYDEVFEMIDYLYINDL